MKVTAAIHAILMSVCSVSSAFAASSTREDNSGVFVWIFLGFCALIVVVQVIPAVLLFFGLAKGLSKDKAAKPQTVSTK